MVHRPLAEGEFDCRQRDKSLQPFLDYADHIGRTDRGGFDARLNRPVGAAVVLSESPPPPKKSSLEGHCSNSANSIALCRLLSLSGRPRTPAKLQFCREETRAIGILSE